MLIKLNGDGALGCEHGILKADAAQTLVEVQQAREEARRECEAARAQASPRLRACDVPCLGSNR